MVDSKPWEITGSSGALAKTKELIAAGVTTLYEAAFEYQGCYARVDIMKYNQFTKNWLVFDPLVFLDFESINPAIPRFEGSTPYMQIPFQFSVHILASIEAEVVHKEFLHDTADDPRINLIESLLDVCGTQGSIVAYFSSFEAQCIEALANYSAAHSTALKNLVARLVDPLPIIRNTVYDNAFFGGFSLKSVAPALLGDQHGYQNMLVAKGDEAQRAFEELIAPGTTVDRKAMLRKAMLEYCQKDTYVMVELVKWMFAQSEQV